MPVSLTDYTPVLRLSGAVLATALSDSDASGAVGIDTLTFTYGRDSVLSASDGDTLSVSLLVRDPWWLERQGLLGGQLLTLTLTRPAGDLLAFPDPTGLTAPIFTGRIVPESVELRPASRAGDRWIVSLTAMDLRAWSGSIVVGQPLWPAEVLSARLARLHTFTLAAAGFGIYGFVPAGITGDPFVNALDVDRKPVADMLDDLASGLGMVWTWTTITGTPTLQLSPMADDSATTALAWQAGVKAQLTPTPAYRADFAVLPGNVIAATDAGAPQSTGAVNEVRVDYTNATPAAKTYVASDLPSQSAVGLRSMSVTSQLRDLAAVTELGDRLLRFAQRLGRWSHPPITWDASPPAARPNTTTSVIDATARAAVLLASQWSSFVPPTVFVAGSVYNRLPGAGLGAQPVPGAAVPWWQVIGGQVDYRRGRLAGTLTLAPRYFSALPTEPTWATLTGAGDTRTWTDLAATMVDRSVVWADLPAFATT